MGKEIAQDGVAQNIVNWNDIDRVPSQHDEPAQDKQMAAGESGNQTELKMGDVQLKPDDGTLNDRQTNTYKSPIMPITSENFSETYNE